VSSGERVREAAVEPGGLERVGVAAFGEQPDAAAGDQDEAVEQSVGELDRLDVVLQLGLGDVADHSNVRVGGARRGGACQDRQRPSVPRGAQRR
jgi:hypothetical protein